MRFDVSCILISLVLGFGYVDLAILPGTGLRWVRVEKAAQDCNLRLGRETRNQLIDVSVPFKLSCQAIEVAYRRGQFCPPLGEIGLSGANLDAAITELRDVFRP